MMQKTVARNTLEPIELEVIQMLYGLGSPSACDISPGMTQSQVREIERRALRKLRHFRIDELTQLRRAG